MNSPMNTLTTNRMNILMVSPFSGRQIGGGLAVMNQDLTKAFTELGHDVRLLTMALPEKFAPKAEDHGCKILFIENKEAMGVTNLKGKDEERELLYKLLNSSDLILSKEVESKLKGFTPDLIVGHSRFSGPAAIQLRAKLFPDAKVEYLLHSYPIEGSILVGHEAYEENIDSELARKKLAEEREWMTQADVAVGVGPLMRYGATLIVGNKLGPECKVYECIPGTRREDRPVEFQPVEKKPVTLLMSGRANVPIKGFEDLLLAVRTLRENGVKDLRVKVRGWEPKQYGTQEPRTVNPDNVQEWANGVLGIGNSNEEIVKVLPMTTNITELKSEIRESQAVLMPSYAEHFGLVPFDGLSAGVPVLMSEFSGAGLFLGDPLRFGDAGRKCIVQDFGDGSKQRPLQGTDFLLNVTQDAFDRRPEAWALAISDLIQDLRGRFSAARDIYDRLAGYTWPHCALGLTNVLAFKGSNIAKQGADGMVMAA